MLLFVLVLCLLVVLQLPGAVWGAWVVSPCMGMFHALQGGIFCFPFYVADCAHVDDQSADVQGAHQCSMWALLAATFRSVVVPAVPFFIIFCLWVL